jgi:hypothetical protein
MQFSEARGFAKASRLNVSHRKGKDQDDGIVKARVQQAATMCDAFRKHIEILADRVNRFGNKTITQAMAEEFASDLFGITELEKAKQKVPTQRTNQRDAILREFNIPARGTHGENAWDLLNAVTAVASSPLTPEAVKSKKQPVERIQGNLEENGTASRLVANATQAIETLVAA